MKFDELMQAVRQNHDAFGTSSGESEYANVIEPNHIRWDALLLDDSGAILDFLNGWGRCRLNRGLATSLLQGLMKVATFAKPIRNLRIEETVLAGVVETGSERLSMQRVAHCAFDELANIAGFGPVPASKTLHVLAPGFFVMWDNAISKTFGCRLCGYDYAFKFLPQMQIEIGECVADLMKSRALNRDQSLQHIRDEGARIWGESRTIAKLVDEYNWTRGKLKGNPKKIAERQLIAAHKEEYDRLLKEHSVTVINDLT